MSNAIEAFCRNPNPVTAIALAISDHKAYNERSGHVDNEFVVQLQRAIDTLETLATIQAHRGNASARGRKPATKRRA